MCGPTSAVHAGVITEQKDSTMSTQFHTAEIDYRAERIRRSAADPERRTRLFGRRRRTADRPRPGIMEG